MTQKKKKYKYSWYIRISSNVDMQARAYAAAALVWIDRKVVDPKQGDFMLLSSDQVKEITP